MIFRFQKQKQRLPSGLAVLSMLTWWIVPVGPVVSAMAVRRTRGSQGWSRRIALAGAVLCVSWATMLFSLFGGVLVDALAVHGAR